jgi:hypothetical protein
MTNKKISDLPVASTPLAGTELVPIVQGGITDQVSVANLTAGRAVNMAQLNASGVTLTSSSSLINTNTSDGSDNKLLYLTGGGAADPSRGSFIISYGNDFGGANAGGNLDFVLGSGTGGYCRFMNSSYGTIVTIADPTVTIGLGNVDFGTAAKGINFTANTPAAGMTSQLLNWYEEGAWTPTFTTWAVAPTLDHATYTRIGRQVTLNVVASGGTCSAGNSIGGLPFNSSTAAGSSVLATTDGNTVGFYGSVFNSSASITNLTAAVFVAGRYWCLSTTYFV